MYEVVNQQHMCGHIWYKKQKCTNLDYQKKNVVP